VPTEKLLPRPPRPTLAAADRPVWAILHHSVCHPFAQSTPSLSSGGRLSFSVGRHLAARRHPDHLLPGLTSLGKCLLRTIAARVAPIRPPRRRVLECDAVADAPGNGLALLLARAPREMPFRLEPDRVPTPLASLAQSGGGSLARTAAPAARALARLRSKPPPPRSPPNICCSRPPCLGDFSRQRMPPAGDGPHSTTRRAAAERRRWAGGSRCLLLQFGSSALAASCSAGATVPDTNRARHLRSSARRGCPASERCLFTRVAYAPPSRGLALRHCLHGSPRLILAVHIRDRAPPKSLPLMRADRRRPPLPPRPTPAAADRPVAAIFHASLCRPLTRSTAWLSSGGG
jgi:hypothetical protein